MQEGRKVATVATPGPVMITADLHGNLADFERLRDCFLASVERGEQPVWISVGDWVHGPSAEREPILDGDGAPLYAYPDETPALLAQLFALMDRFPGQVLSLCGNHEHAHVGGLRTGKFHRDEAAHLESRMTPAEVAELKQRFASWPIIALVPSCGVVVTHGAAAPGSVEEYQRVRYAGGNDPRGLELMRAAMSRYGFDGDDDLALLERLSTESETPYHLIIHGHDREELGHYATGKAALLLCTSFGARRAYKTYVWLDGQRRYRSLAELRDGIELRRLWP